MKRRWLALGMVLVMTAAVGCGKTESASEEKDVETVDYAAYYSPILDDYYDLIYYGNASEEIESHTGVMELLSFEGSEETAEQIGYSIEDISGDGVPELLMSFIHEETEEGFFGRDIFAVYHYGDGAPKQAVDGGGRNAYYLMENGDIFYSGSAGAAYSIFGTYEFSQDGSELICKDYYFTHEQDEDYADLACYHNTTGEWDKDASEKLDMTLDEFWQMEIDMLEQVKLVELTPFIDYVPVNVPVYEGSVYDTEAWVNVDYADGIVTEATNYDWFTADDSPDSTKVLFMAEGNVRDFKFLSLFCEDVLEDGTPVFDVEELYQADRLDPERPLLVEMTFWGTIPSYGYSFVDDNGETQRFTLEMSGMDGSIYIGKF